MEIIEAKTLDKDQFNHSINNEHKKIIEFYKYSKTNLKISIICLCLFFLIIPFIVLVVLSLVYNIKSMILDYPPLKSKVFVLGLVGVIILGFISVIVIYFILKDHLTTSQINTDKI